MNKIKFAPEKGEGTRRPLLVLLHSMHTASSNWARTLRSIILGLGFFFLGSLSELWLQQHARSRVVALFTDALLGIGVGLLVLFYERRQQRNLIQKLQVIRLMNHHVRNSLQVICFAASTQQQEKLAADVQSAVERIEWALREVLPGQKEDINNLLFPPPSQMSAEASPKHNDVVLG